MSPKKNTELFLSLPKLSLSILGIWMLPSRSILFKIYTFWLITLQITFLISNLIYMGVVWGDLDLVSEGSYLLFTHITLCCKAISFVVRKEKFNQLLQDMDLEIFASQLDKHDNILSVHSNRVRKIYMVLVGASIMNCLEWSVIPLLDRTQKILPFNVWMPINVQISPNYELSYLYQILLIVTSAEIFLAIDAVIIGLVIFICAQLDMIMVNTQKIQNVTPSLSFQDKNELIRRNNQLLVDCITHHQAANRFLEQVADMFNINIFLQMSGTIIIVCVLLFRISVEPPNTVHFYSTLNYFIVMLAQLFLYCWCGNELTIRSEELRDWLYVCPWYDQDHKFRRTLCIVMECMKQPLIFKAGHFITLSRPTFVSILRCSYSYFAVLNQANEDN